MLALPWLKPPPTHRTQIFRPVPSIVEDWNSGCSNSITQKTISWKIVYWISRPPHVDFVPSRLLYASIVPPDCFHQKSQFALSFNNFMPFPPRHILSFSSILFNNSLYSALSIFYLFKSASKSLIFKIVVLDNFADFASCEGLWISEFLAIKRVGSCHFVPEIQVVIQVPGILTVLCYISRLWNWPRTMILNMFQGSLINT